MGGFLQTMLGVGPSAIPPAPPQQPQTPTQQGETIQSFAGRVRAKYPGAYDNKPDDELVHRFVTKYPVYAERLAPAERAKLPDITKSITDPANQHVDPLTYSRIYSSYHPEEAPPAPVGFWNNVKAEAKNIWHGMFDTSQQQPFAPDLPVNDWLQRGQSLVDAGKAAAQGRPAAAAAHAVGAVPVVGPTIEARARQVHRGDIAGAAGAGLVDVGAAAAPIVAGETVSTLGKFLGGEEGAPPLRQRAAETLARPTLDLTTGAAAKAEKYGHVPERAVVGEKVSTSKEAQTKMDEVGQELGKTLEDHNDKRIDVSHIINDTAKAFIDRAEKHGKSGITAAVEKARDAYLKNWGDLNKTPKDAAAMKTEIRQEAGKFTGADEVSLGTNQFRKALASAIRNAVDSVTDDARVRELNQRYGDLADARDAMHAGELKRSTEGPFKRLREGAETQGMRKVSQIIGKQYPNFPERPAPPTLTGNQKAAAPSAPAAGRVAGEPAPKALPGMGETGGGKVSAENPPEPPKPQSLAPGEKPKPGLPAAFSLRGTDLQSDIGPEARKPLRMPASSGGLPEPGTRETTVLPSSGQTIEAGSSNYKPPTKAEAVKAAAPPPTQNELRAQLAELDRRYKNLNAEYARSRAGTQSAKNMIEKMRDLSAKRQDLRERLGVEKPEAKPLSITPESKVGQVVPEQSKPEPPKVQESPTPTFDTLSKEEQDNLRMWDEQIDHLPQSMREGEEEELARYGAKGGRRIERLARRYAESQGKPIKKTTAEGNTLDVLGLLRSLGQREPGQD